MSLCIYSVYSWQMNGKFAWVTQELPSFAVMAALVYLSPGTPSLPARVLIGVFLIHYFHRYEAV